MRRLIYQGILIGVLLAIFMDAAHWLIAAPADASTGHRIAVIIQMVVVVIAAVVVWRKAKRDAVLLEVELLSRRS